MSQVWLTVGRSQLRSDQAIVDLAGKVASLDGFITEQNPALPTLTLRRVENTTARGIPLTGGRGPAPVVQVNGTLVEAFLPEVPESAETLLRLMFHLEASRRGGLLVHASGVVIDDVALVAFGRSGAGKSTFARLASAVPGATLLSDEIVALFPDGTCHGTPFQSDYTAPRLGVTARAGSLFTLVKDQEERIVPASSSAAIKALLDETYASPVEPIAIAELLTRVTRVTNTVGIRELHFRKHPEVAGFLREWVREHRERA